VLGGAGARAGTRRAFYATRPSTFRPAYGDSRVERRNVSLTVKDGNILPGGHHRALLVLAADHLGICRRQVEAIGTRRNDYTRVSMF
jgi:hypothetical protein